jgi:glycosyltransferase involved in cell wall biosynthesis
MNSGWAQSSSHVPQISVIIPVFNDGPFVAKAIESVQNQQLRPLEIIVVDDGSTDSTKEIVSHAAGPVPVFYHYQANQGPGVARNLGVSLARGEWIAFLDADDIWYPQKLTVQWQYATAHPEAGLIYSDFDVLLPDGRIAPRTAVKQFTRPSKDEWKKLASVAFAGRPFPFPSTVLVRKNALTELSGFRSDMRKYFEDFELFARLVKGYAFFYIAQNLAQYRLTPKSQRQLQDTPNLLILLGSLWQLWQQQPDRQALLIKQYAYHYALLAKYALQDGKFKQARQYYRLSFAYSPALYYPWRWKNLRRWGLCYLPGLRQLYTREVRRRAKIAQ